MLPIAAELVRRGHRVQVLTGSRFSGHVAATGAEHIPLPAACDFDGNDLDAAFPERTTKKPLAKLRYDIDNLFSNPIPHQYAALRALLDAGTVDAVLVESAFCGALPMVALPRAQRPPAFMAGVLPVYVTSRDTPPIGLGLRPGRTALGRARDAALRGLVRSVIFKPCQRTFEDKLREAGAGDLNTFLMDGSLHADAIFQLTCPSFEFPRRDLPPGKLSFVGAVIPPRPDGFTPPPWWDELDSGKPVVLVTQGTIDNGDFARLVTPTLQALSDTDVLVVVTTGGKAYTEPVPANARVAEFIPYADLLPKVSVMVTNGGYGGVHFALTHGVPLVCAGDSEGKQDIAALVSYSGVGVNLRSGAPKPKRIRKAVEKVLGSTEFRDRARVLQGELAELSAVRTVADRLEAQVGARIG